MKKVFIINEQGKKVPYYALATKYKFSTNKKYAVFMSEEEYNKKTDEKQLMVAEIKRVNGIDFKFHELDLEGKKVTDYLIDRLEKGKKNKVKIRSRTDLVVVNNEAELNHYISKYGIRKQSLFDYILLSLQIKYHNIFGYPAAAATQIMPQEPKKPELQLCPQKAGKQDIVYYLKLVDKENDYYQLMSETGHNHYNFDINKLSVEQLNKVKESLDFNSKSPALFFGNALPKQHGLITGVNRDKILEFINKDNHGQYNNSCYYENYVVISDRNGILDLMSIPVDLTKDVKPVVAPIVTVKPVEPFKETVLLLFENDANKTAFQKHLVVAESENTFARVENQGIYTANTAIRNMESYIRRGNIELLDGKAKILSGHSFSNELDRTLIKAQTIKPIRTLLSKDKKIIEYKDYTLEELLEIQMILLDYPSAKTK